MKQSLFLVLLLLVGSRPLIAAPQKPNFVIIFIDDMGYGDIGPFGATKQKTPHLDRMAREGLKLTSFYAAPVCSVSRAQLLTGCYGPRISVPGVYFPGQRNGMNPDEITIAERLKSLGYATACVGKWHLGDQPEFLPTNQGFDHYFGIPYSNDMQKRATDGKQPVTPLLRDDKVAELLTNEEQSTIVERYTDEAVKFIRGNKDKPFFLYLPHTAVHTPIYPGESFKGKSSNGRFGDWVEELDWSTGRVLDTLRESGLDENTLVIFTSDNGPWLIKGRDGGSSGPLRGGKGSTWEGGMREPTIVRWPGKVKAGSASDTVCATIDLLPTLVSLAGGEVPDEPVIDGRDISALLLGKTNEAAREAQYYFSGYSLQAVRQGPWKLAIVSQNETMGKGVAEDAKTNPRLYNLDDDIGETNNVAEKHPDVVAKLHALAEKMNQEIAGGSPAARRPAGVVQNPKTLYPTEQTSPKNKAPGKPVTLGELKLGASVASGSAPPITGRGFTIGCTVETDQQDAVILAHGGLAAGYALHLRGGRAVFVVRYGDGDHFNEIASPDPVKGSTQIAATLGADRTMSLSVNGKVVATGKAESLITRQPQEDFCLGHDNQMPVTSYAGKDPFEGTISKLSVTTK